MKKQVAFATALVALGAASWGIAAIACDSDAAEATSVRLMRVAQPGDAPQEGKCAGKRGRSLQPILDQLGLSADQQTRIAAIQQSGKEAKTALRSDTSLTREQKRERMRALHQEKMQRIEAVLTPEQRTKFQSLLQALRQKRERGPGNGTPVKQASVRI